MSIDRARRQSSHALPILDVYFKAVPRRASVARCISRHLTLGHVDPIPRNEG
jgi:hypothetical protein